MNLGSIQLLFEFSIFLSFWQFRLYFGEVCESKMCRKAHRCDPYIFSLVSVSFEPILSTRAMRKDLMSSEKKYVNLCHLGFFSECSLRGGKVS